MHDLEKLITQWRNSAGKKVNAETLDELETHLRETTEQLVRSTSRLHSIARVSLVLGSVALFLTTLGVLLGMVWAKIEWGRYWSCDSKEIGGLSVVVWLACYLVTHRLFKSSERGVLAISMLGNIVASLAWFGPQVNGLHQYGTPNTSLLLTIAILVNLAFFAIGFVPAGRLRLRNDG